MLSRILWTSTDSSAPVSLVSVRQAETFLSCKLEKIEPRKIRKHAKIRRSVLRAAANTLEKAEGEQPRSHSAEALFLLSLAQLRSNPALLFRGYCDRSRRLLQLQSFISWLAKTSLATESSALVPVGCRAIC